MVGTVGFGCTTTFIGKELDDTHPLPSEKVTLYKPGVVTTMLSDVAAFDHTFPEDSEDISITESPSQKVVEPPAVMVGADGFEFTETFVIAEVDAHPFPSV
jgi:hypothetical protein